MWRQLSRGLRALMHRSEADQEVADEVQHYLEQATQARMAEGLSRAEARRAAQLEIGGVTRVREAVRTSGWEHAIETLFADLRYGARRLRAAPGFTAITILTLAIGIGATTAIFSAVNPILFQPLPYPDAARLVMVWEAFNTGGRQQGTFGMYADLKERARSFESVAVLRPWDPTMTGQDQPERFAGQRVSASYFHVLGVSPALGRDFEAAEDRFGGPRVVLLSDALWRRRFDADRAIIGRPIILDGDPWVVIGVMPRRPENVLAPEAALWAPLQYDLTEYSWGHHLRTVARLKPGIGIGQATSEVDALGRALAKQHRDAYGSNAGFAVFPALQAANSDPSRELQLSSARTVGAHRTTRGALVIAEVALALVLLVSSGLLLRSLQRLFARDAGFDGSHLLTMEVQVAGHRYDADSTTVRFFQQALDAVQRVPGVSAAALTSQLPLSGDLDEYGVHVELNPTDRVEAGSTFRYGVSPGYIETMHIPLRRGRGFAEHDRAGAPLVALVSESFARSVLKGMDPIGQRMRIGPTTGAPFTVVGVVGDVKQMSLASGEANAIYVPESQWRFADNPMSLVVKARGDAASLAPAVRRAVWSVDKDQPIVRVAMMADLLAATAAERRFALVLFEAFALAALVLAAAGMYGVLAGSVAERAREIGVRAALGATRGNILALVLRQGLTLTGLGALLGLAGAVAASQAIASMLFGVSRLDPLTYAGVIALLLFVALIACSVPAWRAARVDAMRTLRTE